jgi:two-component system, NarL family, sensor histidine kinase DesK
MGETRLLSASFMSVSLRGDSGETDAGRGTLVVIGFLCAVLIARAVDAVDHGDFWYTLFVGALFVLPIWFASGVARERWTRWRWWLLGVQAVLTYVPFAVFGNGWVSGISGLLGGLVLLTMRAPVSWLVFGGLMALEEVLWFGVVGLPYEPALHAVPWVLIAYADNGLALFGLTWLAQLVRQVDATRGELAAAAVTRQRLVVAERLRSMVVERIQTVTQRAQATRCALPADPCGARAEIMVAGVAAREMIAEARAMAVDREERIAPHAPQESSVVLAPRLARGVLLAVLVLFATLNLLNAIVPADLEPHPPIGFVVAVTVSVAIPVLQLRHSSARGTRPRGWRWTFAAQAVLSYIQFPFGYAAGLLFVAFLAGSALLLFSGRGRWIWFCVIVASLPVLDLLESGELDRWSLYATASTVAFGLLVYGLSRLSELAVRLAALRSELAELAAVRERLRLARDTHDLLGLGLSAVALKTDLIAALIGRDDRRAARELDELLRLCDTAAGDARMVAEERLRLSFTTELGLADDILTSSGIAVRLPDRAPVVPEELDEVLATVVREAVTNILRHSAAQVGTIALTDEDGVLCLRIRNDGVAEDVVPDGVGGHGLVNLRARVEAAGGRFTARRPGGEFELSATFPHRVRK